MSVSDIIALSSLGFVIVAAILGVWWRLHLRISDVKDDLHEFKLEAAKTYATAATIKEVEERVVSAITRLGDRLDRAFERKRSDD